MQVYSEITHDEILSSEIGDIANGVGDKLMTKLSSVIGRRPQSGQEFPDRLF